MWQVIGDQMFLDKIVYLHHATSTAWALGIFPEHYSWRYQSWALSLAHGFYGFAYVSTGQNVAMADDHQSILLLDLTLLRIYWSYIYRFAGARRPVEITWFNSIKGIRPIITIAKAAGAASSNRSKLARV